MVSHIAQHTKVVDIFGRYVGGNNSECLLKITDFGVEAVLTLHCNDKNGEKGLVVIEMYLAGKKLTLSSRRNREIESERVNFDLSLVFSYSLLAKFVHNYIETMLLHYEYNLYTEMSCVRTVKPISIYHKVSQYARTKGSIIHFFGTPNTRSISLKTNECEVNIFVDTDKVKDRVIHYSIEAVKSVDGNEDKSFFVKDSTDYAKALNETVGKL